MDKKSKTDSLEAEVHDEESAFEIIELATEDIQVLTRAFQVINNICEELTADSGEDLDEDSGEVPEQMLH